MCFQVAFGDKVGEEMAPKFVEGFNYLRTHSGHLKCTDITQLDRPCGIMRAAF